MTIKIEYLPEGSPDCPLIRIYGNDPNSALELHSAILRLAEGERESVVIHRLTGFQSVDGCGLVAVADVINEGVRRRNSPLDFTWTLAPALWKLVAGFVEPFTNPSDDHRHQWLCGKEARLGLDVGAISVLLSNSPEGRW